MMENIIIHKIKQAADYQLVTYSATLATGEALSEASYALRDSDQSENAQALRAAIAFANVAVEPYITPPRYTQSSALAAMDAWIEALAASITGAVPLTEKLSWPIKEEAAKAYKAGTADVEQTAMLEVESAITGETVAALADKIATKGVAYRRLVSAIAGLRRKTQEALNAAKDPYEYQYILEQAAFEAHQLQQGLRG